jgi:hypothetical protein
LTSNSVPAALDSNALGMRGESIFKSRILKFHGNKPLCPYRENQMKNGEALLADRLAENLAIVVPTRVPGLQLSRPDRATGLDFIATLDGDGQLLDQDQRPVEHHIHCLSIEHNLCII